MTYQLRSDKTVLTTDINGNAIVYRLRAGQTGTALEATKVSAPILPAAELARILETAKPAKLGETLPAGLRIATKQARIPKPKPTPKVSAEPKVQGFDRAEYQRTYQREWIRRRRAAAKAKAGA